MNGLRDECSRRIGEKQPELHPSRGEFVIPYAEEVPADVVAPPAVADVGRGRREERLEGERLPRDDGVAGEPDRIAVTARTGVPGEGQRPVIAEVEVVEHPQRVDAGDPRVRSGLPVEPPEVDAVRLETAVQDFEVRRQEAPVGDVEGDRLARGRVPPERGRHRRVRLLVGADAVGRMHIERDAQSARMQFAQKLGRRREKCTVPGVTRPTAAVGRVDVGQVPVHVEDGDREREPLLPEPVQQGQVRLGGVGVEAAPPVAEREPGHDRRGTGDGVERPQRLGVILTVGEHVQVDPADGVRADPALVVEEERARVVDHGIARTGDDARLERDRPVGVVQGAGRAAQVGRHVAVAPDRVVRADPAPDGQGQPARAERPAVVREPEARRHHLERAVRVEHPELGHGQSPIHREGGRAVFEDTVRGVLQPDQALGEHGDAVTLALDDRRRVGRRGAHSLTDPAVSPPTM